MADTLNPEAATTLKSAVDASGRRGRVKRAVNTVRTRAKGAREAAKEVPKNVKGLVTVYGRTALLVYAVADIST